MKRIFKNTKKNITQEIYIKNNLLYGARASSALNYPGRHAKIYPKVYLSKKKKKRNE